MRKNNEYNKKLKLEEEKILKAMKSLQKKGILRIENNKIIENKIHTRCF